MKKFAAAGVLAIAVVAGGLWYAKRSGSAGPRDPNPFEKPYALDKAAATAYVDGDPIEFAAASGRFYWPTSPIPGNLASEYDEARRAKVREIVEAARAVSAHVTVMFAEMHGTYGRFVALAEALAKADPRARPAIGQMVGQLQSANAAAIVAMHSAAALTDAMPDEPYSSALISELSVLRVASGGASALETAELYLAQAALLALTSEAHKDPQIRAAGKALEAAFDDAAKYREALTGVSKELARVHHGLRQLESADADYGRAALESIRARAPKVLEAASKVKPSEYLSAGDIAFARGMVELCRDWASESSKDVGATGPSAARSPRSGEAWAAGEDAYSNGFRTLKTAASAFAEGAYDAGAATLGAAKDGFRKLQRGVQLGTDYLATGAKMTTRVGLGVYYGDRGEDIKKDLMQMGAELRDNWHGKLPKKTTLRQAKELLDEVEQTAEDAARTGAEGVFGEGWKSWMVGKGAKMVVGAFNGLAKGIYLVGDPSSSGADYVEGSLELIFAGMGGTKTVLKASQTPKLGAKAAQLAREGWKVFSTKRIEAQIARLTELLGKESADDLGRMLSNMRELAGARQSLDAMRIAQEEFVKRLKQAAAESFQAMGTEAKEGLLDALRKRFAGSLGGLADSMRAGVGGTRKEVFDTLMGGLLDEALQEAGMDLFRSRLSQEEIAGSYKGSMRIDKVTIDESKIRAEAAQSNDKQCLDLNLTPEILAAIKKMEGKSNPASLVVRPLSDAHGTFTFSGSGQKSQKPLKYTYSDDGEVEMEGQEKGATTRIVGRFVKSDSGEVSFEGKAVATFPGITIEASLTGSK